MIFSPFRNRETEESSQGHQTPIRQKIARTEPPEKKGEKKKTPKTPRTEGNSKTRSPTTQKTQEQHRGATHLKADARIRVQETSKERGREELKNGMDGS